MGNQKCEDSERFDLVGSLGHGQLTPPIHPLQSFLELCKPGGLESGFGCILTEPCGFCVAVLLIVICPNVVFGFCLPL